jgi:hypothetical protein
MIGGRDIPPPLLFYILDGPHQNKSKQSRSLQRLKYYYSLLIGGWDDILRFVFSVSERCTCRQSTILCVRQRILVCVRDRVGVSDGVSFEQRARDGDPSVSVCVSDGDYFE